VATDAVTGSVAVHGDGCATRTQGTQPMQRTCETRTSRAGIPRRRTAAALLIAAWLAAGCGDADDAAVVGSAGGGTASDGASEGTVASESGSAGQPEPVPEAAQDVFRCPGWAYRTTQRACDLVAQDAVPTFEVENVLDLGFAGGVAYTVSGPFDAEAFRVKIDPLDPDVSYISPNIRVEWDFGRGTLSDFAVFFTVRGLTYKGPFNRPDCAGCEVLPFPFEVCDSFAVGTAQMYPVGTPSPFVAAPEDVSVFTYGPFIESSDSPTGVFVGNDVPREVTDIIFVRRPDACPDWPGPDARFPYGRP